MNQAHILSNCRVTGYKLIYLTSVSSWKYTYIQDIIPKSVRLLCKENLSAESPVLSHALDLSMTDSCLRAQFKLKAFILIYCDYFGCQFSQPYINPSSIVVFFTLNEYVIVFAFLLENFFGKYDTQFTVFGTLSLALNWLSTTTTTTTPTPTQKPSYPW